jgi:hypothetical protein
LTLAASTHGGGASLALSTEALEAELPTVPETRPDVLETLPALTF